MAKASAKKAPKKAPAKKAPAKKTTASKAPAKKAAKKAPAKKVAPPNIATGSTVPLLEKVFHDSLKDIFWAEKHLTKALPKMKKAATTEKLKNAFDTHLVQTKEQIARLEQVFMILGKKAQAKKCAAMEGLVAETEEIISETEAGTITRDVALIMAAQKVEHYEIAAYGGLATLAKVMGNDEVKELLGTTLQEEKDTDMLLTEIAENDVNYRASEEDEEVEEDDEEEDDDDEEEEDEE